MENKVSIYATIDENIKNLADDYVHKSKINNVESTNTRNKLIEKAFCSFIEQNPIN